jgi:DNA protecting protein DprA
LWPLALRQMLDPPPVLFIRGALLPDDTVAVAIVGARQCTLYGREQAEKFARGLAQAGLTIISGGARGIDTAAHYGALRAGGRTIVVSGCGLGHCYPPENDGLYDDIINRQAGCIISEMPPDEPPLPRNFPPRNRIIAALSLGTLVVEANLRSGSMITARLAAEDYGRDVFAVPGRVDSPASSGTHHLIRIGGAELVESANDILATLGLLTADPAAATVSAAEAEVPSARPFAGRRQSSSAEPESPDKLRRRPAADNRHEDPTGQHTSHRGKQKKSPEVSTVPVETDVPPEPTLFSAPQEKILSAIGGKEPLGIDALCQETALPAAVVMAELTMLELRGLIRRTADRTFTRA